MALWIEVQQGMRRCRLERPPSARRKAVITDDDADTAHEAMAAGRLEAIEQGAAWLVLYRETGRHTKPAQELGRRRLNLGG